MPRSNRATPIVASSYRAADHMREMAKAANAGAQNLGNLRDRALDAISSAESDGFRVSDDLTVTDTRPYPNGSNFYAARQAEADEHHSYIAMWAGALASADDEVGTRLRTGAVALDSMIPADWRASDATWSTAVQAVDYTTRPEAPPTPSEPTDAFSVNDAGDVHRIVDLLPPGRHPGVKTLPNARAIEALYGHLTPNPLPGPASTYPGQWRVLSDGTKIGLRQTSKFGGPTVRFGIRMA